MSARLERIIVGLCVFAAAGWLVFYLALALQRVGYPFELEWMEGGSLEHLMRVLRGEPLYPAPSVDFVPFPYPPFYYYLAAGVSLVTGPGFLPLRAISLASSLGVAALIHGFVRRETGRAAYGLIAAGIFLGTWRASGLYFDVARLDSLFALLLLGSLFALRFSSTSSQRGRAGLVLAAVLGSLAVMTKQTGAAVLAPMALWCVWADARSGAETGPRWQRCVWFALPLAALVGGATLLLDGVVDEHFLRYVVSVQQGHAVQPRRVGWFFLHDLLIALPVPCAFVGVFCAAALARARRRARAPGSGDARVQDGFYAVALLGVLVACIVPRIKEGGAANNLIPAHAWLAVMFGLGVARLDAFFAERSPAVRQRVATIVAVLALAQLAVLFRLPHGYLPTDADAAAGRALEARIERIDGEVLMPVQGYLAGRAGKRVSAHQRPVTDIAHSGLPEARALRESFAAAVREQRFAAIVDSNTAFLRGYLRDGPDDLLDRYYRLQGWLFEDVNVLLPISGAQIRAGTLWLPRALPGVRQPEEIVPDEIVPDADAPD